MARAQTIIANFQDLNPVIHERTRLAIMTFLVSGEEISFTELKLELELTDGNLNLHMKVLEKNGFAAVEKAFVDRRPRTTYRITPAGQKSFRRYVELLECIIGLGKPTNKKTPAGRTRRKS
jgi:DNA-binding MarR family transcriptional regulator